MRYTYTTIEEYVHTMYESINVLRPIQLDPETIAARLGLSVLHGPAPSVYVNGLITVDDRLSEAQQWQSFAHELCHALWHVGNQIKLPLPFREYQEEKAMQFALHACIPTSMLMQQDFPDHEDAAVDMLCTTFCVEQDFARRRLHQYIRNRMAMKGGLKWDYQL